MVVDVAFLLDLKKVMTLFVQLTHIFLRAGSISEMHESPSSVCFIAKMLMSETHRQNHVGTAFSNLGIGELIPTKHHWENASYS